MYACKLLMIIDKNLLSFIIAHQISKLLDEVQDVLNTMDIQDVQDVLQLMMTLKFSPNAKVTCALTS